ncbi:MAG TPA: FadR/GntR family transcriptional regulator [Pseudonocardia sp.]|jgi:DNA-binding FadR family transcriptional regulator|nr:FadR/GntR family transcriptional regulator [Pseudonocardia sp.]
MSETADGGWQPVRRLRTHEHVLAQIEQQILDGRLSAGDRLPGERELADYLGVSRAGVREALRVLEALGVLSAGVGSGPGSGSVVRGEGSEALATLLRLHLALSSFTQSEVMEVRVQLERWSVSQAAVHATAGDVSQLRGAVLAMRQPDIGYEQFNELDTGFHVSIAEMSGNALLGTLMRALRDAVRREMLSVFESLSDWRAVADRVAGQHQEIVDAIEAGDSERAAGLVDAHITTFYSGSLPTVD